MDRNLTALERDFQIAKSGDVTAIKEVRRMLRKEGYQVDHIAGGVPQRSTFHPDETRKGGAQGGQNARNVNSRFGASYARIGQPRRGARPLGSGPSIEHPLQGRPAHKPPSLPA